MTVRNIKEIQNYLKNGLSIYREDAVLLGMPTAERLTQSHEKGALIVDTETGDLYVGDNSTNGGLQVNIGSPTVVNVRTGNSIKDAIDNITDASSSKRYIIKVSPGTYTENNPINMKPYVNVIGDSINTVIVQAQNAGNLFNMADSTLLKNVGVIGEASSVAINACPSGLCAIEDIGFFGGDTGLLVNGATASANATNLTAVGSGTRVVDVQQGFATVRDVHVTAIANYDEVFHIEGASSILIGYGLLDSSGNCTKCISITGSGIMNFRDGRISSADVGVYFEDSLFELNNMSFSGCTLGVSNPTGTSASNLGNMTFINCTQNISFLSPTSRLAFSGFSDADKTTINPNIDVAGIYTNEKVGDEGFVITKELHVGFPGGGAESCLGEGDSYTKGMMVYTYDGSSYVDVSEAARSTSGSPVTFPNTNVNTAIYLASDYFGFSTAFDVLAHYGIKASVTTPHTTGSIIAEYWNGSAWTEVKTMTVGSSSPYTPHADEIFLHAGSHQTFYDAYLAADSWSLNDPVSYGKNLYWIRFRITSGLDVAPVIEQFKLHTNNAQTEADGWMNYYGTSRPIKTLPWDLGLLNAAAASPLNADMYLSDTLDIGRVENRFAPAATDRAGFSKRLPLDLDTSSPINLKVCVRADGVSGGNYEITVRHGFLTPSGNVYNDAVGAPTTHPTQIDQTFTVAAPTLADTVTWFDVDLDVSGMVSRRDAGYPDILFLTIERAGTNPADTNSDNMDVVEISGDYIAWCNGGHV